MSTSNKSPKNVSRRAKALLLLGGVASTVLLWGTMSGWPLSLHLLRFYPKKLGSSFIGWVAGRSIPQGLRLSVLGKFAQSYGVDLAEAEKPLGEYPSLQAFFTRRLKPGLRPQEVAVPGFVNSPVDARIIAGGPIEKDSILQAKGLPYRVTELLKNLPNPGHFEGGHYLTLYLSPKDYHRIHVPIEGTVTAVARVEGELWPVNNASTTHVPRLYERNRRAAWLAHGTGADEGLEVAAVCVGATHVGGVIVDERWLEGRKLPKDGGLSVSNLPCAPGDDLATFQFGSTVVLIIGGPKAKDWVAQRAEGTVKVGQRLGAFR